MNEAEVGKPVPSTGALADKLRASKEAMVAAAGLSTTLQTNPTQKQAAARAIQKMVQRVPSPTLPHKRSSADVIFSAARANLGAQMSDTKTIRFVDYYYMTDNAAEISFLRKSAEHFNISEVTSTEGSK